MSSITVFVVAFDPREDASASVGGFEWRFKKEDAEKYYHFLESDILDKETHDIYFGSVLVDNLEDNTSNHEITEKIDDTIWLKETKDIFEEIYEKNV